MYVKLTRGRIHLVGVEETEGGKKMNCIFLAMSLSFPELALYSEGNFNMHV